MLERLSVRNYVLIDKLDIEFRDGFSVITGETGSGKSILLGALSLVLGAKADREAIRKGEKSAEAAAVFSSSSDSVKAWLEEHDAAGDDGEIIIRRSIKETGRSLYTVNGIPVSRKEGEELGALLVDISSQHAHQALLRPGVYRAMLDEAAADSSLLISPPDRVLGSSLGSRKRCREKETLRSFVPKRFLRKAAYCRRVTYFRRTVLGAARFSFCRYRKYSETAASSNRRQLNRSR